MLQALHQTGADGVVDCKHNDWNGACCPGGRDGGSDIRSQNDIDFLGDELANDAVILGIEHGLAKIDRKSTRLNPSHQIISYAVFCLKKKKKKVTEQMIAHFDRKDRSNK